MTWQMYGNEKYDEGKMDGKAEGRVEGCASVSEAQLLWRCHFVDQANRVGFII